MALITGTPPIPQLARDMVTVSPKRALEIIERLGKTSKSLQVDLAIALLS